MRLFFYTMFFVLLCTSAYAQGTAGLTIPANQTFVLGEYRTTGYKASVTNKGNQKIAVVLIDRKTGEAVQRVEVEGGTRQSVQVPAAQVLHLVNSGNEAAELKVKSPVSGSQGMGFLEPGEATARKATTKIELSAPIPKSSESEEKMDLNEKTITKVTLEPGQSLIIGEGSAGDFNVTLSNNGSGLDVSGRKKGNGRKTQGFGLGKFAKVGMYLRPNEVLYLVNNSDKRSTIKLKMDRKVQGTRIIQ
jgi:hypothetical protein